MSRRGATTAPAGLVLADALAWWLSVDRMRGMNAAPSAELGGLGWFTATWLLMMTATMLPATEPTLRSARAGHADQSTR